MKTYRVNESIKYGTRDGVKDFAAGDTIELPDDEADTLLASGEISGPIEAAVIPAADAETRTASGDASSPVEPAVIPGDEAVTRSASGEISGRVRAAAKAKK